MPTRPTRARRAPERYTPEVTGPLEDDYADDEHDEDDVCLEDDDVTSIVTTSQGEGEGDSDADVSEFVVEDHDSEPEAGSGTEPEADDDTDDSGDTDDSDDVELDDSDTDESDA
jgi:hypothetical protein